MEDTHFFIYILNLIVLLSAGIMLTLLPYITRKSLLFGVRIPGEARRHPQVLKLKKRYSLIQGCLTLLLLLILTLQQMQAPELSLLAALYLPLLLILAQFAIYLPSWRAARLLKKAQGWFVSAVGSADTRLSASRQTFRDLPWGWYIGSALLCVLAAIFSVYRYPQLPDTLAVHWDFSMQPDRWADKNWMSVLNMPLVALGMIIIMAGSNLIVWRMKLQVNQEDPALSYAQHRVYRRLLSHILGIITLLITLLLLGMLPMTLNLLTYSSALFMGVLIALTVLMIALPLWLTLKAGQAGHKLRPVVTDKDRQAAGLLSHMKAPHSGTPQDDRFWKLGLFYLNPDDPTLFVEDRFGNNGGLNFARPIAWLFIGILALIVIATYVFSTILFIRML